MELNESLNYLTSNGYFCRKRKVFLGEAMILNEAAASSMLKKIPDVLRGFKKRLATAKKEGDKAGVKEVVSDVQDLKQEIYDKGILNKFRDAKKLKKVIFGAMAVLMLSAGATNAMAASQADANLGGSGHGASHLTMDNAQNMWDSMDAVIDKACADAGQDKEHCSVTTYGDGDDDHSSHDGIKLSIDKEKDVKGGHVYLMQVDSSDGGKTTTDYWMVRHNANGSVDVNTSPGHGGTFEAANNRQIAWLNAHGNNFLK